MKGIEMATFTTPFNNFSKGLHTSIQELSNVSCVYTRKDLDFMIAGSIDGKVYFAPSPCFTPLSIEDVISGHSGKVNLVYLTNDCQFMISGSTDSLFVWKIKRRDGLISDTLTNYNSVENVSSSEEEDESEDSNENDIDVDAESDEMNIDQLRNLHLNNVFDENKLNQRFTLPVRMINKRKIAWARRLTYKNQLKFVGYDINRFKDIICYYGSKEKINRMNLTLKPQYIFGIDESECYENLFYFDNSGVLATFSRSNPWTIHSETGE